MAGTARADVVGMERQRGPTWTSVAVGAAMCAVGLWALAFGNHVPLLTHADLGFHELGHLVGYVTRPPEWMVAIAGTVFQIAVPLAIAAAFGVWRRDAAAAAAAMVWAATSMRSASVYVADAPHERLPLIGGEHDWAYLLGEHWSALDRADDIAAWMVRASWGLWLVALVLVVLTAEHLAPHRGDRRPSRVEADASGGAGIL